MSEEKIICAAIYWDDGKEYTHQPRNITSGSIVCGYGHHTCFHTLARMGRSNREHVVQGFLTTLNRFVDRKEAATIAFESGQINEKDNILFSEKLLGLI